MDGAAAIAGRTIDVIVQLSTEVHSRCSSLTCGLVQAIQPFRDLRTANTHQYGCIQCRQIVPVSPAICSHQLDASAEILQPETSEHHIATGDSEADLHFFQEIMETGWPR